MKLCVFIFLLSIFLFASSIEASSQRFQKYLPHYVQMQYSGYIGLISGGVGYNLLNDRLHISLLDGYTPKSIAGSAINAIAVKTTFDFARIPAGKIRLLPYAGLGGIFETSRNGFYFKLPEQYPNGYYKLSAAHAIVFLGVKMQMPFGSKQNQRIELYGETGTMDTYIYYFFRNGNIKFTEIFSGAIGATYHFGRK